MTLVTLNNGDPLSTFRAALNDNFATNGRFTLTDTIDVSGQSGAEWEVTGDEVAVVAKNFARSNSGETRIQLSYDNGSSWEITDYLLMYTNKDVTGTVFESGVNIYDSSTSVGSWVARFDACKCNGPTLWQAGRWIGTGTNGIWMHGAHLESGIVDRMRLVLSTGGGTFTSGTLQVLQKGG